MRLQKDPEGNEKKYLHQFADLKEKRVLEVGCGEGRLTWKYAGASSLTVGFPGLRTRANPPESVRRLNHSAARVGSIG